MKLKFEIETENKSLIQFDMEESELFLTLFCSKTEDCLSVNITPEIANGLANILSQVCCRKEKVINQIVEC